MGDRAAAYVKEECNWNRVAGLYASFLQSVVDGKEWTETKPPATSHQPPATSPSAATSEYITSWAANTESVGYLDTHLTRLVKTLEITPPGGPEDRILEMGAYLQITPSLRSKLGYGCVRGCYYGPAGKVDHRTVTSAEGETFECAIDLFDAEKDRYPYPDAYFTTVLCCELIEHLTEDPMHLMSEINRIVKPGGHLVLTTPNIASLHGIAAVLEGFHPGIFTAYIRPRNDEEVEARHNREYTPKEIQRLLENSGFTVTLLETGPFRETPRPEEGWVLNMLDRFSLSRDLRGEDIYVVGRKTGTVRERYPNWLYA
jgi:SAM-dependent methyltransferase